MSIASVGPIEIPSDEEAELVQRAKARDPEVWARWHDEFYPLLYRYAAARLRSETDAEDVVSQVFLEAIKGIDRYSYRGRPILAWLYGIARHLVSRRFRESSRTIPLSPDVDYAAPDLHADTLTSIELRTALEKLKDEHRDVLVLRFVVGLPTRQVASILGKTEAATYSLQVRAVQALRRELGA
jgi:RNA polymerase sigma-70 factor (ECF subfamily)